MTQSQVDSAAQVVRGLGLPPVSDTPKTWDTLGALGEILRCTGTNSRILDAGAETYSRILPWLYLYGYRDLLGNNLVFERPFSTGSIRYEPGDLTAMPYPDCHFDAVSCLSVIEHGVNIEDYFREMRRVLRPGGVLVTSADYFETPTKGTGKVAYGVPVHVFDKEEIRAAIETAKGYGFEPTGPINLESRERVVTWSAVGLSYTFVIFSLIRR